MACSTTFLVAVFFLVLWDVEFLAKYECINNTGLAVAQDDLLRVNSINRIQIDINVVVFI
jgi:hypothetical protein